jgi:2-desacetyl-2-hydroxyethyl bacteriochlorophyllide A dehydrogenase
MKAVVYDKSSSPDNLVMREVEKPVPQDTEVLVKIHAVSINAADYRSLRMGLIPKNKIFGADIAGRVESAGKAVKKFKAGDDVFGDISGCGFGGFAEYAVVPENVLARKPAGVSYQNAAAVPMAALTALQGLRDRGRLKAGQKALIYGAGGGVGTFAVQLAKHFGAHVTAVCGKNNVEIVRSLGADRVVDYAKENVLQTGEQFDLILGVNGSHPLLSYRRALSSKGIFVMVGGGLFQVIKTLLFGGLLSVGGKKMRSLAARPDANDLDWVIRLVAEGKVNPVIDRSYPLSDTAAAMRYASQGHACGKVVICVI